MGQKRERMDEIKSVVDFRRSNLLRNSSANGSSLESYQELNIPLSSQAPDLICLSHLRWDFVYQRPQHLMSRFARERRVFFIEEPIFDSKVPKLDVSVRSGGVTVVVPHLPQGLSEKEYRALQQSLLLDELFLEHEINNYVCWYYTPMALAFTQYLEPMATIYDCMDELSAFKNAPRELRQFEAELFERADVVFTGGYTLYKAKAALHSNVHPFPSSIDQAHFSKARKRANDPDDQCNIARPRLGYCGVIDERMNPDLIAGIAEMRPDWQIVMIGPVVKIDPADLPKRDNIHYLGGKHYQELPTYFSGWDVALLPFALNESTRYISPTKTPEYLAAGIPAISTSINDVIHPYGQQGLVRIADTPAEFVEAAEYYMSSSFDCDAWLKKVDEMLANDSWDRTWKRMSNLLDMAVRRNFPSPV
ncbi:MAG TPA: glycosyltransferase family 1 protein, partial [Blastocatellia bacterium]|nr:glycosyltransferase family 1 protein [Blastocatellia bacterium]